MQSGHRAVRPYEQVIYLDSPSTELAIRHRLARAGRRGQESQYRGQPFQSSKGGCLWVRTKLYAEIGGFDERFRGFGFEDSEFWDRLSKFYSHQSPSRHIIAHAPSAFSGRKLLSGQLAALRPGHSWTFSCVDWLNGKHPSLFPRML